MEFDQAIPGRTLLTRAQQLVKSREDSRLPFGVPSFDRKSERQTFDFDPCLRQILQIFERYRRDAESALILGLDEAFRGEPR